MAQWREICLSHPNMIYEITLVIYFFLSISDRYFQLLCVEDCDHLLNSGFVEKLSFMSFKLIAWNITWGTIYVFIGNQWIGGYDSSQTAVHTGLLGIIDFFYQIAKQSCKINSLIIPFVYPVMSSCSISTQRLVSMTIVLSEKCLGG